MAKKTISQEEKIATARIFVENHLSGHLTPNELQTKLNREGLNYTKVHRNSTLIFVIRGNGIERTELIF
jgi:hypothetical protein